MPSSTLKHAARQLLKTGPGQILRRLFGPVALRYAVNHPSRLALTGMVFLNQFLTSGPQVEAVFHAIRRHERCKLLIFGFGNDSPFYQQVNATGRTVFLEDHPEWFANITEKYPQLEAYRISYRTRRGDWRLYMKDPAPYATELPPEIANETWDVIFVDAPAGFEDDHPGRMESIRLGAALIKPGGDVFVHDCEREVERVFSHQFLKVENLREEIGNLRHYVIPATKI